MGVNTLLTGKHRDQSAVFNDTERTMIRSILHLSEWPIKTIMTRRSEVVWLEIDTDVQQLKNIVQQHPYSCYPVCHDALNNLHGIVQERDVLLQILKGGQLYLQAVLNEPLVIHEDANVTQVLEQLRQHPIPMAIIF